MPEWNAHLRPRLAALRLSPTREAEIVDELSQHLDDRCEQLRSEGHDEAEATRLALEELRDHDALAGGLRGLRQARAPMAIAEGSPRRWPVGDLAQDLRYAVRMLWKQPSFALAAVVTLALGIGANTAVFSLINETLFQRLPVANPDRLFYLYRGGNGVFAYPQYAALRDRGAFDGLAGWGGIAVSLHAGDSAELVPGIIATGNFFDVLGVEPAAGRLLGPADDVTPGAHPVAVIAHSFWQTRFGGRPDTIGREIRLNGHVFTIVGVAPVGFPGPQIDSRRDIYVPMMMQAVVRPPRARYSGEQNPDLLRHNTNSWIFGIGRMKAGASPERVKAELDATLAEFFETRVKLPPGGKAPEVTLAQIDDSGAGPRRGLRAAALLIGGAVGVVLLIACANIANLLLSRAAGRGRELAVRLALGASRGRLLQQLLTESVVLSLIGGLAGVVLAWAILRGFAAAPPPAGALPLPLTFTMDGRVLLFAFVVSSLTGILCGVVPALVASRPAMGAALRGSGGSAGSAGNARRVDLKKVFVVAEVALSLLLLVGAGLFVRSLRNAHAIDPGLDVDRLVSAPLQVNLLRYTSAQGRVFYQQVVERVRRVPGVESASVARVAMLGGGGRILSVHVEGGAATHDHVMAEGSNVKSPSTTVTNANVVGPGFFQTVGIRLLQGRDFADTDTPEAPAAIILNATAARLHFADANPLGKRISVDGPGGPWREIVGVVRDSAYGSIGDGGVPVAYLPLAQNHETGMILYVRASVPPGSLASGLRREIQQLEPNLPVPNIAAMAETVGTSLYAARMGAWLLSALGGLALLLAVVGIYGVLSFSIARRTREMGIRLALGAGTRRVFLLVVRDGMWLVLVGVAIGLGAAMLGARSLGAFLYGISPTDGPSFAGAVAVLAAVAFVACAIPARRAIRVDPVTTLRQE